jgi:fructokinase
VIGEALIDLVERAGEPAVPVVGGSPLNVAVGLSRLGVASTLHTHLGSDEHGSMIERHLATNQVGLSPGSVRDGRTSVARASIGPRGAASYRFDVAWDPTAADPVPGAAPVLVHTGSIAAVLDPGAEVVATAVAELRSSATITYDPNVRPALMGERTDARARIERLVRTADVVKASDEDLAWLYPDVHLTAVARRWLALGPALVVVTRGELGAHAVAKAVTLDVTAPDVVVADTIGAGDSFMAGLLAALDDRGLLGRTAEEELRTIDVLALRAVIEYAASCAAVTVSRVGADTPTRGALL